MIPIIIPTLGRDRIMTLEFFTPEMKRHTTLITPPDQVRALSKSYPTVVVEGCTAKGISATRQYVLDTRKGCVLFSDDDLRFSVRANPKKWSDVKAIRATPEQVQDAFNRMALLTEMLYPMVGMSARQGNNHHKHRIVVATRLWNIWTIDCDLANKEGFKFTRTPTMQDFVMNLSFLTRGYPTCAIADTMHDQYGTNLAGGCSTYRNNETQKQSTAFLQKTWPDFVRVVEKKLIWKGFDKKQPRLDVMVYWKKALAYGITQRK